MDLVVPKEEARAVLPVAQPGRGAHVQTEVGHGLVHGIRCPELHAVTGEEDRAASHEEGSVKRAKALRQNVKKAGNGALLM